MKLVSERMSRNGTTLEIFKPLSQTNFELKFCKDGQFLNFKVPRLEILSLDFKKNVK